MKKRRTKEVRGSVSKAITKMDQPPQLPPPKQPPVYLYIQNHANFVASGSIKLIEYESLDDLREFLRPYVNPYDHNCRIKLVFIVGIGNADNEIVGWEAVEILNDDPEWLVGDFEHLLMFTHQLEVYVEDLPIPQNQNPPQDPPQDPHPAAAGDDETPPLSCTTSNSDKPSGCSQSGGSNQMRRVMSSSRFQRLRDLQKVSWQSNSTVEVLKERGVDDATINNLNTTESLNRVKQQEQRPEPETWCKPVEQLAPILTDVPGRRYGKEVSPLELAHAFSSLNSSSTKR